MSSAIRLLRVILAIAAAAFVLVASACGGGAGNDGGDGPAPYPTPSNPGFGVPIYPGAEYSPPLAAHTILQVIVPLGESYYREVHRFSVAEPWANVAAWYRDTLDARGWEATVPGGRVTRWSIDRDEVGWTDVLVEESGPAVTAIIIYRNTYDRPEHMPSGPGGSEPTPNW
jgi:hypothetical protein